MDISIEAEIMAACSSRNEQLFGLRRILWETTNRTQRPLRFLRGWVVRGIEGEGRSDNRRSYGKEGSRWQAAGRILLPSLRPSQTNGSQKNEIQRYRPACWTQSPSQKQPRWIVEWLVRPKQRAYESVFQDMPFRLLQKSRLHLPEHIVTAASDRYLFQLR